MCVDADIQDRVVGTLDKQSIESVHLRVFESEADREDRLVSSVEISWDRYMGWLRWRDSRRWILDALHDDSRGLPLFGLWKRGMAYLLANGQPGPVSSAWPWDVQAVAGL